MAKSHVNKVGPGPVCETPTPAPEQFVPLVWHPLQRRHGERNWPHIITWSCAARHRRELVFVSAFQLECPKFPSIRQAWLSSEGPHWAPSYECVWRDQRTPSWWGFPECVTQDCARNTKLCSANRSHVPEVLCQGWLQSANTKKSELQLSELNVSHVFAVLHSGSISSDFRKPYVTMFS